MKKHTTTKINSNVKVDDRTEAEKRGDSLRTLRLPKIILTKLAYDKVFAWTDYCEYEVSCLGVTEFDKDRHAYVIHDVFLVKQTVSGASTIMDAEDQARVEYEAGRQYPNLHLNAWIHSHVNMGVFWSSTDDSNIITQSHIGTNDEGLCVAVVVNKRREWKGGIAYSSPNSFAPSFFAEDVPVELEKALTPDHEYLKDFDSYVIKPTRELNINLSINKKGDSSLGRNNSSIYDYDDYPVQGGFWDGDDDEAIVPKSRDESLIAEWYPDDALMEFKTRQEITDELTDSFMRGWITEEQVEFIYRRWEQLKKRGSVK